MERFDVPKEMVISFPGLNPEERITEFTLSGLFVLGALVTDLLIRIYLI